MDTGKCYLPLFWRRGREETVHIWQSGSVCQGRCNKVSNAYKGEIWSPPEIQSSRLEAQDQGPWGWLLWGPHFLASRQPSSLCLYLGFSLPVCVLTSSYEDINHIGLSMLIASFNTNFFFLNDSASKYSHLLKYLGVRISVNLGHYSSDRGALFLINSM